MSDSDYLLWVIKYVHSQHADDLCWMDIDIIFSAAGLPVPDRCVGDKAAMLANCERFVNVMCQAGKWKSYADLEARIVELEAACEKAAQLLAQDDGADGGRAYDILEAVLNE